MNIKNIIFFIAVSVFIFSCESENLEVASTAKLEGKYILNNLKLKSQFSSIAEKNSDINVSSKGIYYIFEANGNYTTNAYWSYGEINKDTKVNSGTYTLSGDNITIKYTEVNLKKELSQKMQIKTNTSSDLVLYIGKSDVLESFTAVIPNLDGLTATLLKAFLESILQFEYTLSFKKA